MATLFDSALAVATQLGRVNADATAIVDLENPIKEEIRNTIRYYNRNPMHLTELRGGEMTTVFGETWYSQVIITNGASEQDISPRTTIPVNDLIEIHYMREAPGFSGLNEPLSEISYKHFERLFEGAVPSGQPEFFTKYAGQLGIWPTPSGATPLYWSGIVRPQVPTNDNDTSVWLEQASEMIEAGAAKRVCSKHLRNSQWAQEFAALEEVQYRNLKGEHVRQSGVARLRVHD